MSLNSLNNNELYDLAAELSYFNADIVKKNDDEKNRVWNEAHTYCQKNGTPFDVFALWLLNRVALVNTSRSKALLERITDKEKNEKFDSDHKNDNSREPDYAEIQAWIKGHPTMVSYSPNNDELYDLVAELGYFNANILRNYYEERKRVWIDVHSYCKRNQIRVDFFIGWLINCLLLKKPASKTLIKIFNIKKEKVDSNRQYKYSKFSFDDSDMEERRYREYLEEFPAIDPQLHQDCEYNDDWDGPKY